MMTKFYDNTIVTKFIKYIISHFNLPIVPFWIPKSFVKKDGIYIYDGNLYRAGKSGIPTAITDKDYFKFLQPFVFGKEYLNMTTRYIGVSNGYDPQTHYYLGEYLRTIKAYYGIDLMSMYNCFNGVFVDDLDFNGEYKVTDVGGGINSPIEKFGIQNKQKAQGSKILSVPIKFGKSYHIAVDCDFPIETLPVVYDDSGLNTQATKVLLFKFGGGKAVGVYQRFNSGHFQKMDIEIPAMQYEDMEINENSEIGADRVRQYLGQYERYLRLLIKIPASNTSSVVVLEDSDIITSDGSSGTMRFLDRLVGEETKVEAKDKDNKNITRKISTYNTVVVGDSTLVASTPKLTFFNDGNIHAFSDTLLQYLLMNVISNMDEIDDNIIRVQEYIQSQEFKKANNGSYYDGYMQKGVWDSGMKNFIFKTVMESQYLPIKLDKFGYVDADTEFIITRGQVV